MNLYTIGFSQKSAEEFFSALNNNNVVRLIDIRLNNKSQLAGFANVKHLPYFLRLHNIEYIYRPDLAPTKKLLDGYKKKLISWQEYERQYINVLVEREVIDKIDWSVFEHAVLLCSEPTAERCHRRLLAEYLAQNNSVIKIKHL